MKNRKTASQFFKDAEIVFKNDLEEIDSRVENFSEEWNIPIGNFFDVNPVDRRELNIKISSGTLSNHELLLEAYYILARRKIKRFQKFVRRVCYSGDRDIIDDAVVMGLIDEKIRDAFLHTQEMIDEAWKQADLSTSVYEDWSWSQTAIQYSKRFDRLGYRLIK